jgi:hypothetical protein
MYTALSSYALVGIEAVPVDVIVDAERVKVVELETRRTVHSVRLESSGSVSSVVQHIVNVRTSPDCNLAPERLRAEKSAYYSHLHYNVQTF